jgi:hypothetical protein
VDIHIRQEEITENERSDDGTPWFHQREHRDDRRKPDREGGKGYVVVTSCVHVDCEPLKLFTQQAPIKLQRFVRDNCGGIFRVSVNRCLTAQCRCALRISQQR